MRNKNQTHRYSMPKGSGVGVSKMGDGNLKAQTSSFNINKSWEHNIWEHSHNYANIVNNTVLHI